MKIKKFFIILLVIVINLSFLNSNSNNKIFLEIYGSYSIANPADLNLMLDYYSEYLNNSYYSYNEGTYNDSVIYNNHIEVNKIKNILPFGFRVKYEIKRKLYFSVGLNYFSKTPGNEFKYNSVMPISYGSGRDKYDVTDFTKMNVSGLIPSIGIHYVFNPGDMLNFEFYLSTGLAFIKTKYTQELFRKFLDLYNDVSGYIDLTTFHMNGSATGISLDTGVKVNYKIYKSLNIFMACEYSYIAAKNPSGSGMFESYKYTDYSEGSRQLMDKISWEGTWGIVENTSTLPYITNQWEQSSDNPIRDLMVDLSGFKLMIGLSLGL